MYQREKFQETLERGDLKLLNDIGNSESKIFTMWWVFTDRNTYEQNILVNPCMGAYMNEWYVYSSS